ncbi:MAG TPA: AgmX/PglI C-terminal domain-containing protein [Kofleriaceae bacterium]
MRFVVGLLCVAACATKPAPAPANVQHAGAVEPQAAAPRGHRASPRLTPDLVLATIRTRYIGGVERCYRRHLKRDATARGRVLVSFTVDAKGRARDGEARGITNRVDDCIAAQVARWQFPRPARESRFALGLELGID